MIPTVILAGLVSGLAIRRPIVVLLAVATLAVACGGLVAASAGADFPGGLGVGAVNAAVGAAVGVALRFLAVLPTRSP